MYGISARAERPPAAQVEAAIEFVSSRLPEPAIRPDERDTGSALSRARYGVGILIVHEATEGLFVLLSWWVGENMLNHEVYFSPATETPRLEALSPPGIVACVWELAVLAHERQAWVDRVLNNAAGPDLDGYLESRLNTDL